MGKIPQDRFGKDNYSGTNEVIKRLSRFFNRLYYTVVVTQLNGIIFLNFTGVVSWNSKHQH